ncbi:thiamine-phosphate kinase, partial [Kocuria rhizophila]
MTHEGADTATVSEVGEARLLEAFLPGPTSTCGPSVVAPG